MVFAVACSSSETDTASEEVEIETSDEVEVVDLTLLSSTMVYAEMFCILSEPEDYVGKTMIVSGMFAMYDDTVNNIRHYGCLVLDEAGCCVQGIDFILPDGAVYPDDYPEQGADITITGTFEIFGDESYNYARIADSTIS